MDLPIPSIDRLLRLLAEESSEHAIMFLDREGRVAWWGPGAARIFGYAATEILGTPAAKLFVPEDIEKGVPQLELEIAASNDAAEDDRWQQRKDGSRFWAIGAMIALRDAQARIVAFAKVLRNRTDLREQLDTLRNHASTLDQSARRQETFISTLSHELRNPLAPLANAAQIIRMSMPGKPEIEFAVKVIERQTELMRRLVDDLLDMSRVSAGKIALKLERLSVVGLLREVVEDSLAAAAERKLALEALLASGPIEVVGDRERLRQVFVNLVNNALKYTQAGGHVWVMATVEGPEAVVKVEDDGIGIPHDMLPRIFDLFTQVESARSLSGGGLGIGLALVKDLAALHGGSVQVRSDGVGKGAEFTVRLPLAPGVSASVPR